MLRRTHFSSNIGMRLVELVPLSVRHKIKLEYGRNAQDAFVSMFRGSCMLVTVG
jgi:hypothetical protein